ncbi:Hpt domain-containing protein [Fusobacterium mortiferum]|jgi:HPt (histidine-containing phosphotransfer) domain-containing protein|uniref:Hpt domain-containing protein n=2 Tax=Fusobacterium mortiferum TaxID=850 RepID=A0A414PZD4_FUSMR|nr:Hpt domain-containing protein [Fusobacterium mortiferum]AVQ18445.1 Hpt domain-containing protein [Fusobacterium mortiferum ATCC 9817]EEO34683.1 Hpt domain protein [Fusobacterium mortiferum ATCC 9817]MCF2699540.1 Hpt domain-containing protein [Fusobacterium mortiferum]MCI7187329.1 Hpt domain-containing protein [Fusobacterium mortiferum]MCI7665540.1 Hpt domain-containing protein [Fusobacterium mortiferum]
MELKDLKNVIDIDIDGSLARFGNMESFYIKFLKKFIDDKSFINLKEALENNNIDKIGEEAHTLKGVAGNLGLNKVYQYSVELMRLAKENNLAEIKEIVEKLEEEIEKVISALKNL